MQKIVNAITPDPLIHVDTLWLTLGLGLCDDLEFNKHIGAKKFRQIQIAKAGDPNDVAASLTKEQGSFPGVRSKCSRIFRESRAEIHDAIECLPGMEHFGSWVPNPCSPVTPVDITWQDDMSVQEHLENVQK